MPDADLDTEARILEAAHRVFLRRGAAGARTQEIADEAGVSEAGFCADARCEISRSPATLRGDA